MSKLFNKKNSSVDLSNSHLVSNEIKWEDFLVDDIEKKLKVVKQAKTDGSNNIPSSSTNNLSNCETKIKNQANNYISRIQKIGTKFFGELKEQLEYLFPLLRTNQFTHFARDLNSGLEKIISSSKNKLEQHRKTLKEQLETLTQFKKNNELSEEARCPTKDEIIKSTLLIIIMFIFELAVNSGILAEALDDGWQGGILLALGFSMINVIFSASSGYKLFKHFNSIIKIHKNLAIILGTIFILIILYLNFCLGAYRGAAELYQEKNNKQEFSELAKKSANPFDEEIKYNAQSILLISLGILISLASIYKGYEFNDTYPGYGERQSKVNKERENIKKIILALSEEILDTINNTINNIQDLKNQLVSRLNDWNQNTIKIQYEFNNYEKKLEILEKNVQQLFLLYRNNNKVVRRSEHPTYFDKINYTIDPKDKDLSTVFSDIYGIFCDDKKRENKFEEFTDKIDHHFNNCLKDIEKVKESFLLKKDKINDEYKTH
jgi:ABC-type phosphate transport system auxiliary subunit